MSAQVISELFQQIVHSEEKIKQRFEALKKVNQGIQDHQESIRTTKYEIEALQGNLGVVNHKLLQEEIEQKWLRMRENILKEQKQESCNENMKLQNEIDRLESFESNERDLFLKESDEFLKEFDLSNDMRNGMFEENMKEELKKLQQQHKEFQEKINVLEEAKENVRMLREEKNKFSFIIDNQIKKKEDLIQLLNEVKEERELLKINKDNIAKKTVKSSEFHSLMSDLENSKKEQSTLSDQHQRLATELYQLQQSYMQNEHRRKQQQTSNPWSVSKLDASSANTSKSNSGRKLFNYNAAKKRKQTKLSSQPVGNVGNDNDDLFSEELHSFDFDLDADDDGSFMEFPTL